MAVIKLHTKAVIRNPISEFETNCEHTVSTGVENVAPF